MDRYKELLDKLTAFNNEMDQNSKDLLSKSNLKFDELYGKLSGMISDLEEEMGKRNDEVIASNDKKINEAIASSDKRFTEINNNFDQQFNSYETKMTTDINGVKEYIDTKATAVSEKLDQVFQRVSNGKKLLASALLTKGVKIGEDATFAEFAKAIQNIPQQMVLDSGETAAEIEYEYHYHKNGKGKTINTSLVSAAVTKHRPFILFLPNRVLRTEVGLKTIRTAQQITGTDAHIAEQSLWLTAHDIGKKFIQ